MPLVLMVQGLGEIAIESARKACLVQGTAQSLFPYFFAHSGGSHGHDLYSRHGEPGGRGCRCIAAARRARGLAGDPGRRGCPSGSVQRFQPPPGVMETLHAHGSDSVAWAQALGSTLPGRTWPKATSEPSPISARRAFARRQALHAAHANFQLHARIQLASSCVQVLVEVERFFGAKPIYEQIQVRQHLPAHVTLQACNLQGRRHWPCMAAAAPWSAR